jgi:hypothetical protein
MNEKLKRYPVAENMKVIDTIGVPHPYVITPNHVVHAADHFSGILGKEAIEAAERSGVKCGWKGCKLPFEGHEQAVLIEVDDPSEDLNKVPGIFAFIEKCKPLAAEDGFAGFAFRKKKTITQTEVTP